MTVEKDPLRWSDDPNAAELGEATRAAQRRGPSEAQLALMAKALGVTAVGTASLAATSSAKALASGVAVGTSVAAPLLLSVATVVGAVMIAAVSVRTEPTVVVAPPAPASLATEVTAPPEAVEPSPAEVAQQPVVAERRARTAPVTKAPEAEVAPATVAPATPPAAPVVVDAAAQMREEASLVRRAESALNTDAALALRLTEEHRARFPKGALDQEAEVVTIHALLSLGRKVEAETRAHAFEKAHAGSLHARRIRVLLEAHRP